MPTNDFINRLVCPVCNEYRYLTFKESDFFKSGKGIRYNLPYFRCDYCNKDTSYIDNDEVDEMVSTHFHQMEELNISGFNQISLRGENERFEHYEIDGLKYDARDYYLIPGLFRSWSDGALTPVFFDKDLLLYYNNHPEYSVVLRSFSNVFIYKGDESLLSYGLGINRNGKLFGWLKDLYDFFSEPNNKDHLYRFLASNVESDHDLFSDYYLMQIEVRVVESDNEIQIFRLKNRFEDHILQKFGFQIFKFNVEELRNEYKPPIMNEKMQVFEAYVGLDQLINENINANELKKVLKDTIDPKELNNKRSLKLLELFFMHKLELEDAHNIISPLFVLYDLRVLKSHLAISSFDEKYLACKERLGVNASVDYIEFFEEVVKSIIEMFTTLNESLETKQL